MTLFKPMSAGTPNDTFHSIDWTNRQ